MMRRFLNIFQEPRHSRPIHPHSHWLTVASIPPRSLKRIERELRHKLVGRLHEMELYRPKTDS
jgi:hypothetical protein